MNTGERGCVSGTAVVLVPEDVPQGNCTKVAVLDCQSKMRSWLSSPKKVTKSAESFKTETQEAEQFHKAGCRYLPRRVEIMQINVNKAIQSLRSVDRDLRAQLAPKGKEGSDTDSVEIGGANQTLSSGYVQIQTELTDQLSSLFSLVGDSSGQQKDLAGMFADAGNDDAVRARAQELLEGYFNVENTGNRIFDFAFSHYKGGDREEFAREMQGHIHKGFAEAEKALGGLADISLETRDYIDQRVEDFINEGKEPEEGEAAEEVAETEQAESDGLGDLAKRAYIPDV